MNKELKKAFFNNPLMIGKVVHITEVLYILCVLQTTQPAGFIKC